MLLEFASGSVYNIPEVIYTDSEKSRVVLGAGALEAPLPVTLVTCTNGRETNAFTVAWTGIISTKPPMTYISVRPTRHSYHIIRESGEFVINAVDADTVRTADACGTYTGKVCDKFARYGLTTVPSEYVSCPTLAESPISLECRVEKILPLGSHHMFIARILGVTVRSDLAGESGRIRLDRARLAAFAHGEYFELGKSLGRFGFSVANKKHRTGKGKKTK